VLARGVRRAHGLGETEIADDGQADPGHPDHTDSGLAHVCGRTGGPSGRAASAIRRKQSACAVPSLSTTNKLNKLKKQRQKKKKKKNKK